jgi:hypothetical protein
MTPDPALHSMLSPVPAKTMDYRTMVGHVVVCRGQNEDNRRARKC